MLTCILLYYYLYIYTYIHLYSGTNICFTNISALALIFVIFAIQKRCVTLFKDGLVVSETKI